MSREEKGSDSSGLHAVLALVGLLVVCGLALFFYQRTLRYPSGFGPSPVPPPQPVAEGQNEDAVDVELQADGTVRFGGKTMNLAEVKAALLASHPPDQAIHLSAPPNATHGDVKGVMDTLSEAGFWNIRLGVSK